MTYSVKVPEAYARVQWCKKTFGPSMQGLPENERAWAKMRWWRRGGKLYFRSEDDYIMYKLRWGDSGV